MFPTDVVIVAGARTPMARYTGAFSDVSAIDLAAHASREAVKRSGANPEEFDHAIFGNVMQTSADALYGARHVALKAGLKIETPAVTVNRLCGSGIEAIAQAAQRLLLGEVEMVGQPMELSRTPWSVRTPTPEPGEHTDAVLGELGYSAAEIADLKARKIV